MRAGLVSELLILAAVVVVCDLLSIVLLAFGFEAPSVPSLVQEWLGPLWLTMLGVHAIVVLVTWRRRTVNHAALIGIMPIPAALALVLTYGLAKSVLLP